MQSQGELVISRGSEVTAFEPVEIYDLAGRKAWEGTGACRFPAKGVYIIKHGSRVKKPRAISVGIRKSRYRRQC